MWRWGEDIKPVGSQRADEWASEVCGIRKWIGLAEWLPPYPFKREIASCREALCSQPGRRAGCCSPVLCFHVFLLFFYLKKPNSLPLLKN